MKVEDVELYKDNCKIKVCKCDWNAPIKCSDCPRQMFTTDIVDSEWKKWHNRKMKDLACISNQEKK